jgi:hypothetical protein
MIKPIVTTSCCSFEEVNDKNNGFKTEKALAKLYMDLKEFAVFGTSLCPPNTEFRIGAFHHWFSEDVFQWLNIEIFLVKTRCSKLD